MGFLPSHCTFILYKTVLGIRIRIKMSRIPNTDLKIFEQIPVPLESISERL
jgi:hypothetical protein